MTRHAEREFWLSSPVGPDGQLPPMPGEDVQTSARLTVRDHLGALFERGVDVSPYASLPCPAGLAHVLQWFLELSAARGSNGFSPSAISYAEIDAWARLTGARPTSYEVGIIRALDACYLRVWASAERMGHRDKGQ